MAYRNIIIQNEAKLSLKSDQLIVKTETADNSVPIEDIDTILVENRRTVISTALMASLAKSGVALFICDEFHMPCAVLQPYLQHSRQYDVTQKQLALSTPAKKQLWKQIVIAKINNQAKCLLLCRKEKEAKELENIAKTVKSGDEGNSEGYAAAKYFPALFGKGFIRGRYNDEDCRNSWLNYGYSIVRGCVARTLAVYGFFPLFGLQHHSTLNQFNLVDDFIEPFRQIVDLFTATYADKDSELTPEIKNKLVNLINYDIIINEKRYALSYAIEMTVQSFSAIVNGKTKSLLLPELVELKQHTYE
jgi:CRISPR-associated protein Cas1